MTDTTILFEENDHTLGNLVRHELLNNKNVIAAAYDCPHPLFHKVEIRAIVHEGCDATAEIAAALGGLMGQLDELKLAVE